MKKVTVSITEFSKKLKLSVLFNQNESIVFSESETNRPGLQLAGFFEHYAYERVQIIGNTEMCFMLQLEDDLLKKRLEKMLSYNPPCIIFTRGHIPPASFLETAKAFGVPVLSAQSLTAKVSHSVFNYIERKLSPVITTHGVLLDVYGVGVMLKGESGMGKSETALEMIKRGHRLVADDVLEIRRVAENRLSGMAPELTRHLMEIRGIGIIDVRHMYGVGAVILEKSIDIVIEMEMWEDGKGYDRLGLDTNFVSIMDVKLPSILIPVRPGRNLAIIVEVAARNFRLKNLGYDAAKEFDRRWMEELEGMDQMD